MSLLETEIRDQPAAVGRFLARARPQAVALGEALGGEEVRLVAIAARGSSDNAARYAQYLLGSANRLPVALATPSLYTVYGTAPRLDGALVVGISQSGASPDIEAVLVAARQQGSPTLALTNVPDSPIGRAADHVLALEAGVERAVPATKTYLNSLAAVALVSAALGRDEAALDALEAAAARVAEQVELAFEDATALDAYSDTQAATVAGRGFNFSTAYEIALKVRELCGIAVEGYSAADLMHGPIAAVRPGQAAVVVAPTGPTLAGLTETAEALTARGAAVVAVSDDDALLRSSATPLRLVRGVPEALTPLLAVIPGQVLAMRLAELRGIDVDSPHGLTKVTRTR